MMRNDERFLFGFSKRHAWSPGVYFCWKASLVENHAMPLQYIDKMQILLIFPGT